MSATELPLIARARLRGNRTAVAAAEGTFTYDDLLDASARVASCLLGGRADLAEARVAILVPPGFHHVAAQWGIWRAGGITVPLGVTHPARELAHVIADADAEIILVHADTAAMLGPVPGLEARRVLTVRAALATAAGALPTVSEERRALMIYTSGTTGPPKGVVTTHAALRAQVTSLVTAWAWQPDDRILLTLPLHHVHGVVNVLTCALWSGAACDMLVRFDAERVWARFADGDLTLFMAVPTIYRKLITAYDASPADRQRAMTEGCRRMRLMVSGSAALPRATLERWREISGHVLLERYGMTEIGMALANPLRGERRPGYVGTPLPGVEVRLVDEDGRVVAPGTPGEIEVRGPGVFREYWRRPDATANAFRPGGWFASGDLAVVEHGAYRILGRTSVDIIKTGGFKVSALEIEDVLRAHPAIAECAVVGVADAEWGERVCVAVECPSERPVTLEELQAWCRDRLAPYKIPRALKLMATLPRNAMGKVTKPDVAALFVG